MRLRLAGGVVAAPGLAAWLPRPRAEPEPILDEGDAPAGAAVALGPDDASDDDVRQAVTALKVLVADGGVVAAGAGVDLGAGFRSARLEGAHGDQRDAVLAALRVLGVQGAARLGWSALPGGVGGRPPTMRRAGFLVALFGPSVTKRVGAAAAKAITEERWAALHLATAASDILGPEQLERVLALDGPPDLIGGGLSSVLAGKLRQVLEPVNGPRRLDLLLSLWEKVAEHHAGLARRARLLATQGRQSRLDDLRKRRQHHEDEHVLQSMRLHLGRNPELAAVARWVPPDHYWYGLLNRVLRDAFAATALLHTAIAVSDHGLEEGLARSATLLRAANTESHEGEAGMAARPVPGLTGLPARPICYVRDIERKLGKTADDKNAAYVRQRLARAHDYARLAIESIQAILWGDLHVPNDILRDWAAMKLSHWRERVGFSTVRPFTSWTDVPTWTHHTFGEREPLATRLEALTNPDPADVEEIGDLLWCADLVDALAMLHGHEAAALRPDMGAPWLDHDPPRDDSRHSSITAAVSGAAQLIAFGGEVQRGVRTWEAFEDGLLADTTISEALAGEFTVPAALAAVDGTVIPGTGARFTLARNARTLAEWSNYMGNCIAGPYYLDYATTGKVGLAALCDENGRILANVEVNPGGPSGPGHRGWRVTEIRARFNQDPDPVLERRFRAWLGTVPMHVDAPATGDDTESDEAPTVRPARAPRKSPRPRLLEDAGPALGRLAVQAWADAVDEEAARVLAALAPDTRGPEGALTALRRLGPGPLAGSCRNALDSGAVDLADLWELTGIRPLSTAIARLDPSVRDRFDQLGLLTGAASLPGSLRKLARTPQVAPAYSMGLVGLRLRAAIGRLLLDGEQAFIRSVTKRTTVPMLCALTVHVTCAADPALDLAPVMAPRVVNVPGFPASTLSDEDGPWQRSFPAARELGADTSVFWDRIASHGLRVPSAWISGGGGWPVLWSRAHHPRRGARS